MGYGPNAIYLKFVRYISKTVKLFVVISRPVVVLKPLIGNIRFICILFLRAQHYFVSSVKWYHTRYNSGDIIKSGSFLCTKGNGNTSSELNTGLNVTLYFYYISHVRPFDKRCSRDSTWRATLQLFRPL